ncbi:hypothetical protein ZWY2020_015055 [Hordeum vulgare]|nr:hypothetical protein ZWY2020_015055 [Hordeum vulgare]
MHVGEPSNAPLLATNFAQFPYLVQRSIGRSTTCWRCARSSWRTRETLGWYATFLKQRDDLAAAEETFQEAIAAEPSNGHHAAAQRTSLWNTGGRTHATPRLTRAHRLALRSSSAPHRYVPEHEAKSIVVERETREEDFSTPSKKVHALVFPCAWPTTKQILPLRHKFSLYIHTAECKNLFVLLWPVFLPLGLLVMVYWERKGAIGRYAGACRDECSAAAFSLFWNQRVGAVGRRRGRARGG